MARTPKPWYDKQKQQWTVWHNSVRVRLGNDKKEAMKAFYKLMDQPEVAIRSDSVIALFDLFLDWTSRERKPLTYEWYLQRLNEFAKQIPTISVQSLKAHHVQKWIDTKNSDGHKRGCITAVQRALNWSVKQGYIDKNPIIHMEKPEAGVRELIISEELHKTVLARCYDKQFHDLLVFSWETGARPQETLVVEARHFQPQYSRLVFPKKEAKGKKRPRYIYLTDSALEIVEALAKRYPQGHLFRNAVGKSWNRNNVSCRFGRMKKHIDIKLCLYAYRHSFGTRLLEEGIDSLVVAALMGHSDLSMLGRVYAHLLQNPENLLKQLKRA